MTRRLRVLLLLDEDLVPPDTIEGLTDKQMAPWKTEYDVKVTLEDLGHEVRPLGVAGDLEVMRRAIGDFKPHVTFNLLEEFHGVSVYDYHVVAYLELLKRHYTGCNPRGLMLAHDKALSKKILAFHGIAVPDFALFPFGRAVRKPPELAFPLLVKSSTEEGSVGISKSSIVRDERRLAERVEFVHYELGTDAIAEQWIDGRELYVGILGNGRLLSLPVWELLMTKARKGAPLIATSKVKWDLDYQKKLGVKTRPARLPRELRQRIVRIARQSYRALDLTGYARIDFRLTAGGDIYLLEANPNPQLAYGEDFAESAESAGIEYEELLQRILNLGLRYRAQWRQ